MIHAELLFAMLIGHAVADYPLQGDFLARGKNHRNPITGIAWWIILPAHALIHGGAVWAITGSSLLGLLETVAHCLIDWLKCDERTSFITDQVLHVICKVMWVVIILAIN